MSVFVIIESMKRAIPRLMLLVSLFAPIACSRDPQEMIDSGKQYLAERRFSEAALEFRTALNANPQLAEAHYQLALAFAGQGQIAEAAAELRKTISINPGHQEGQLKVGNIFILERNFAEARNTAEQLLKQDSTNLRAQILLGNSYAGIFPLNDSIG